MARLIAEQPEDVTAQAFSGDRRNLAGPCDTIGTFTAVHLDIGREARDLGPMPEASAIAAGACLGSATRRLHSRRAVHGARG